MKHSRLNRHVLLAKQTALKSLGVGRNKNYKVGAVLFKKDHVYEARENSYKTHPALRRLTKFPHLHAEASAILHHGLSNCMGLSLAVVRVRQDNEMTMARPCSVCDGLIRASGIKKVYYTNWQGELECLPME